MTALEALLEEALAILAARCPAPDAVSGAPARGVTIDGIGWATVEHDRAEAELSDALGIERQAWARGRRDDHLGAAVRLARVPSPSDDRQVRGAGSGLAATRGAPAQRPGAVSFAPSIAVVVLEPDTEGRIAASLARSGEGVAVAYAAIPPDTASRLVLSARSDGPLGPARLVLGGRAWGPHLVLLDR